MNQFHSVIPFVFLILTCLGNLFGQASEQKINESELLSLLQSLAVDDDEVRANVITSLAKSGDPQLERFFELYRQRFLFPLIDDNGAVRT